MNATTTESMIHCRPAEAVLFFGPAAAVVGLVRVLHSRRALRCAAAAFYWNPSCREGVSARVRTQLQRPKPNCSSRPQLFANAEAMRRLLCWGPQRLARLLAKASVLHR